MGKILSHYEINEETYALLPILHTDYNAIVFENDRKFLIKQTPLKLIKEACLEGCSTYDGRRTAVTHLTGSKQKVPIPINPHKNIFAFPTHSPSSFQCSWIFYNHIKSIKPHHSSIEKITQSIIIFKNGQQLQMNESNYILQKQMQRTAMCILLFKEHV